MRKHPPDDVAEAARRRLELLSEELTRAGLTRLPPDDQADASFGDEPPLHAGFGARSQANGEAEAESAPSRVGRRPGRHLPETRPEVGEGETDPSRWRARASSPGGGSRPRVGLVAGWLADRLPSGVRGQVRLREAHLVVVALVVAAALTVAALWSLRSNHATVVPAAAPAAPLVRGSSGSGTPAVAPGASPISGAAAAATSSTSPTGAATVVVDVAGKVHRPGVVTLPSGSRVIDALRRAGGARHGVDLTGLNLAEVLTDGQQIVVGGPAAPVGVAASAAATSAVPGTLVNINDASAEELDALPHVGPVTAQKIIDWRTQHGGFSSVDQLLQVSGIGDKTLADMAPYVTL